MCSGVGRLWILMTFCWTATFVNESCFVVTKWLMCCFCPKSVVVMLASFSAVTLYLKSVALRDVCPVCVVSGWSWKMAWHFLGRGPATPLSGPSVRMQGARATGSWPYTAAGRTPTMVKGQCLSNTHTHTQTHRHTHTHIIPLATIFHSISISCFHFMWKKVPQSEEKRYPPLSVWWDGKLRFQLVARKRRAFVRRCEKRHPWLFLWSCRFAPCPQSGKECRKLTPDAQSYRSGLLLRAYQQFDNVLWSTHI